MFEGTGEGEEEEEAQRPFAFFGVIAAAYEPRLKAVALDKVCHEPGFHAIFEEASPTFKMRFMYMSGYKDEEAFDRFRQTLTWVGHSQKIRAPLLCLAGECDELSPLHNTVNLVKTLRGRKRLVVYAGARHSLAYAPSTQLGPSNAVLVADRNQKRRLDEEDLVVSACYAGQGPSQKRVRPAPMGRARGSWKEPLR